MPNLTHSEKNDVNGIKDARYGGEKELLEST